MLRKLSLRNAKRQFGEYAFFFVTLSWAAFFGFGAVASGHGDPALDDRGGGPGAWHSFGNAFFTVVGGCAAAFVRYALQTAFGLLAAGCGADRSLFFRDASVCGLPQQKMDPAAAAAGTALL